MFAKVYTQIFASSIAENYTTRHVFMDLLVLADPEGVVDMTMGAISRTTNVPLDVIKQAIQELSEPDKSSRSPEEEGRRIALIDSHRDWGWRIINYDHYRTLRDEEARRSYNRNYMRKYRNGDEDPEPVKSVKTCKDPSTSVRSRKAPSTQEEEEVEGEEHTPRALSGFAEFWEVYPKKIGKGAAEKAWKTHRCWKLTEKILSAVKSAKCSPAWKKEEGQYIPNPTTYLNQKRWEDSNGPVSTEKVIPMEAGKNDLTFDKWKEQA